jgi:endonuclease G
MKKLILLLLFLPLMAVANGIDDKCPKNTLWGAPSTPEVDVTYLCRMAYAVGYSNTRKTPVYVVEHVIKAHLKANVSRTDNFRPDPELDAKYRSELKDYEGSNYDRGHLAPAGDFVYSKQAMSESFLLSNMMPQDKSNNRGIWKHTEELQRNAALKLGEVYVISGTIYTHSSPLMMGTVGVPNAMYKIIVDPINHKVIAFIFPNKEIPESDLPKYVSSVKNIEDVTGIKFFPNIPQSLQHLKTDQGNLVMWLAKGPVD